MQQDLSVPSPSYLTERPVHIPAPDCELAGSLGMVSEPRAVVIIASDTGASRHRSYELELARVWRSAGLTTLMVDLISAEEQSDDDSAAPLRIDAKTLSHRIGFARAWLGGLPPLHGLPFGLLGEGGAGAAALIELSGRPLHYAAAVVRDAQPLRAGLALEQCALPVLLVVDSDDEALVQLNREGLARMHGEVQLATFSSRPCADAGSCATQQMSTLVTGWLIRHLLPASHRESTGRADKSHCSCRPCGDLDH